MTMPRSSSQFSSSFSSNFTSTPSLNISKISVGAPVTSLPAFDKHGLNPASLNRLQQAIGFVDSSLRLPDNPRAFGIYLLGLLIVFIGAFLQVLVSAQIMQAEVTLARLQEDFRAIEQQNGDLAFQIARDSNMERLHERVLANGYEPVTEREYIIRPSEALASAPLETTAPDVATTAAAGAVESTVTSAGVASAGVAAEAVTPATAQTGLSSNLGGQVARWEEFWSNTWRATFSAPRLTPDNAPANISANPSTTIVPGTFDPTALSKTQPSQNNPNFWAVWWEQASDQGAKLLDQLSSR
jgi:hypothetical protein